MADRGTRNTRIAFGDYEIAVALKKCQTSRDPKTEYVNEAGETVKGSAGTRGKAPDGCEKAVRLSEAKVVRLPQDRLEAIAEGSKDRYESMEVLECIDYRKVPTERICGSYWMQPREGTARGLRLLAEALRASGTVAVVKWVGTSREKLGVIRVRGREGELALLLSELAFANDFLRPDEDALAINDVDPPESRSLTAALGLVGAFARKPGDPHAIDEASDTAVDARLALIEELSDDSMREELEASVETAGV